MEAVESHNALANNYDDSTLTTSTRPCTKLATILLLAVKETVPVRL